VSSGNGFFSSSRTLPSSRWEQAVQDEVRNAAWTLLEAVKAKRDGKLIAAGENLKEPRQK
jgi:hypothetical protein